MLPLGKYPMSRQAIFAPTHQVPDVLYAPTLHVLLCSSYFMLSLNKYPMSIVQTRTPCTLCFFSLSRTQ